MIYIDTSALLKLVRLDEPEAPAISAYVDEFNPELVSSALLAIEARRGMLRSRPEGVPKVDQLLGRVELIDISGPVIESASRLPDPLLRSLDAIHLATALLIRQDVDAVLTYDQRLLAAATTYGLPTAAPT